MSWLICYSLLIYGQYNMEISQDISRVLYVLYLVYWKRGAQGSRLVALPSISLGNREYSVRIWLWWQLKMYSLIRDLKCSCVKEKVASVGVKEKQKLIMGMGSVRSVWCMGFRRRGDEVRGYDWRTSRLWPLFVAWRQVASRGAGYGRPWTTLRPPAPRTTDAPWQQTPPQHFPTFYCLFIRISFTFTTLILYNLHNVLRISNNYQTVAFLRPEWWNINCKSMFVFDRCLLLLFWIGVTQCSFIKIN